MKKLIELTPEWVLENLSQGMCSYGGGKIGVYTNNPDNANWISLALDTLKIPFEVSEITEAEEQSICYEFKIKHIKDDCPSLYEFMKNLDKHNLEFKQIG